jgi:hypothetical protein
MVPFRLFDKAKQCFGSGSALILVCWIRIQDKNNPSEIEKREEISSFEVLDVLF